MARIFWDGERIVATAGTANINRLSQLAEKYKAECLPSVNGYAFLRTVQTIKDLSLLEQTYFDDSFQQLLDKVNKREQANQDFIDSLNLPEKMYPFQKATVAQIVKWMHNTLIAGEMGVGKTCMGSVALKAVGEAYPALIVCPASLKLNWQEEIHQWTPGLTTYVINGRETYKESYVLEKAKQADVVIINYDILGFDNEEKVKREKKRIEIAKQEGRKYRKAFIAVEGWVDAIINEIKPHALVCDECQALGNPESVRSRAIIQISKDNGILKLFLSGTPFETKVLQFYTICHIMNADLFPSEWDYKQRYCDPYKDRFGHWHFDGVSNVEELRRKLSTFMIRLEKKDVLPFLPPKQKIPVYLDMDKKAREVYDKMEEELLALEEGSLHQFTYLAKMKEALMEIKVNAVIQFIKDMFDVENKLVTFVFHTKMFETLMTTFGAQCVGINGGLSDFKKQDAVKKFQNNPDIKQFVGQFQAACSGITLTASHIVIFTEWGQTAVQMEQASDRIHRIGQESERCLYYYLIIKDTIDEDPMKSLTKHYNDIQAVLNGNTNIKFVDIDESMILGVKSRRLMKGRQGVQIEYN